MTVRFRGQRGTTLGRQTGVLIGGVRVHVEPPPVVPRPAAGTPGRPGATTGPRAGRRPAGRNRRRGTGLRDRRRAGPTAGHVPGADCAVLPGRAVAGRGGPTAGLVGRVGEGPTRARPRAAAAATPG